MATSYIKKKEPFDHKFIQPFIKIQINRSYEKFAQDISEWDKKKKSLLSPVISQSNIADSL